MGSCGDEGLCTSLSIYNLNKLKITKNNFPTSLPCLLIKTLRNLQRIYIYNNFPRKSYSFPPFQNDNLFPKQARYRLGGNLSFFPPICFLVADFVIIIPLIEFFSLFPPFFPFFFCCLLFFSLS